MSYEESVAQFLVDQGIPVATSDVPSVEAVDQDVQRLRDWLGGLEVDTQLAIDDVTANNAVQAALADTSVGIVASIGGLLAGFDNQSSAISISVAADMIAEASSRAAADSF